MAIPYIPLLYHSNYGRGGSSFASFFESLVKYGIKHCGIADNNFFGLAEFINYSKAYGIKPLIGGHLLIPVKDLKKKIYFFTKNKKGYANLCALLTAQAFDTLEEENIIEHAGGLVMITDSIPLLRRFSPFFNEKYYLLHPGHDLVTQEFDPIAVNEIFYATEEDRILYKLMSAIKDFDYEHKKWVPNRLLTNDEFHRYFTRHPEAIINNLKIAEQCPYSISNEGWIFPKPDNSLYPLLKTKMRDLDRVEKTRLEYEYQVIRDTGFEPYFSLVYHLKEFARQRGIGMNVRGSAASSFILYVLGLSVVNPIKYSLPFERFLNPKRTEPPDIDVDVEYNQREQLIKEIFDKFGADHVAHIAMINRFQRRARFRNTARAYGISAQEIKNIHNHQGEDLIKYINELAGRIDNYPNYFSCHPSGIILTPENICHYAPLYPSPAGQITHFDKDGLEIVGLVKLDILGVRGFPALFQINPVREILSLTGMRDGGIKPPSALFGNNRRLKSAVFSNGIKESIDFHDPKVYETISRGKTLGCFQIESPLVRQFLKKIKPKTLLDIANAIAIIRPGPSRGGMKQRFLRRLKGEEPVDYPHPSLKNALAETLGVPVYQEQILQIAHDFAAFSLSDGDMLRRAMTKDRVSKRMQELEELFFRKARQIGYQKQEIMKVWERIYSFSAFGFNKAHAVTYGTLAYLSAYQKLYEPINFFCRMINNKGGYYTTHAYINEARRWGIKILDPDVNLSQDQFTIYRSSLITGLNEIKNLSAGTIRRIIKYQPFKCAEDFFNLVKPSIEEGIALIKSCAMDGFNYTHPQLNFLFLIYKSAKVKPERIYENIPPLQDFTFVEKKIDQLNTLSFLPQNHILEIFCPHRSRKITDLVPGYRSSITGTPIVQSIIRTRNNRLMSFVTLDDETGTVDAVIFPDHFRRHPSSLIVQIEGVIKDDAFIASDYRPLLMTDNR
ncbi:hypothetical protein A2Y85_08165 [candidate division WOR-3 bacterium RBG_13_43_14]|uniref:DNA-directed DNA polymerase n=1 Tax=candidate division WOR-3 bacterium RBG_13_43_14 TaxID=1802590 RepID=A0A1F4U735_UNCW3|nr:MAG: hypothetical protein A2Y85_08165 [candidate division WOR-3 bacterium RBG_13_43_14]